MTFSESRLHIHVRDPPEFLKLVRDEIARLPPDVACLVKTAVVTGKSQTIKGNEQLLMEISDCLRALEWKLLSRPWKQNAIGIIGPRAVVVEVMKFFSNRAGDVRYRVEETDFEQRPITWSEIVDGAIRFLDGVTTIHVNFTVEGTGRIYHLSEGLADAPKLLGVFDLGQALVPQFTCFRGIRPGNPLPVILTRYDALAGKDGAWADAAMKEFEAKIRDFFHEQGLGVTAFYRAFPGAGEDLPTLNEAVITLILDMASRPPTNEMPEIPYKLPFGYLEHKISTFLAQFSPGNEKPNRLPWTDKDTLMVTGALKYHMQREGIKLCPQCGLVIEGGERCADGTPSKRATAVELSGNFYLHALRKMQSCWETLPVPEFEEVIKSIIWKDLQAIRLEDMQASEEEIYSELAARTATRIGKVLNDLVYMAFSPKSTPNSPLKEINPLREKTYIIIPQGIPAPPADSYAYKVVVEDQTAGQGSALLRPFVEGKFDMDYKATIGTSIMKKELSIVGSDAKVRFIIWDLAIPAEFKQVRQTYFQNAEAGIVFFDVTRRETFKAVEKCVTEARRGSGKPQLPVILVGTNASEPGQEVSQEEVTLLSKALGLYYVESAGAPQNWVNGIFESLARILIQPKN